MSTSPEKAKRPHLVLACNISTSEKRALDIDYLHSTSSTVREAAIFVYLEKISGATTPRASARSSWSTMAAMQDGGNAARDSGPTATATCFT
ncbi:hypothetical protein ACP4OV_015626 [Aristida adscensionis]